jgi:hypothetical protein
MDDAIASKSCIAAVEDTGAVVDTGAVLESEDVALGPVSPIAHVSHGEPLHVHFEPSMFNVPSHEPKHWSLMIELAFGPHFSTMSFMEALTSSFTCWPMSDAMSVVLAVRPRAFALVLT